MLKKPTVKALELYLFSGVTNVTLSLISKRKSIKFIVTISKGLRRLQSPVLLSYSGKFPLPIILT